ncbi:MAG: hypothetical protein JNM43_20520 [Planctomycetaceae bacterium]|nr:hypothetical protein [Planctomycetaceae bacterium]
MSMKKREKILATLFAGALAGWGTLTSVESWFSSSTSESDSPTELLQRETVALTQDAELVDQSLRRLKNTQEQSLPGDPGHAASLYQAWLMKRLELSGLKNATVTPAPPIAEENLGHRILASIEASGTQTSIARFVDAFSSTPLLHRIASIDIMPTGTDDEESMRVSINVEALSLTGAERAEIPEPVAGSTSLETLLASQFVFAKPQVAVPTNVEINTTAEVVEVAAEETPPPTQAPIPKPGLRFVAAVQHGAQREAWFVETSSGDSQRCLDSSRLTFGEAEISVVRVDRDETVLQNGSKQITVRLGETVPEQFLKHATEQGAPAGG